MWGCGGVRVSVWCVWYVHVCSVWVAILQKNTPLSSSSKFAVRDTVHCTCINNIHVYIYIPMGKLIATVIAIVVLLQRSQFYLVLVFN